MTSSVDYSLTNRWLFLFAALIAAVQTCEADPSFAGGKALLGTASRVAVPPFRRKLQSWVIRNSRTRMSSTMKRRVNKASDLNDLYSANKPKEPRGSFFTFSSPTKERLYNWFGVHGEDPNQLMRCMILRNQFNNKISGITNPFLKIQPSFLQQHTCHLSIGEQSSRSRDESHPSPRSASKILQVDPNESKGEYRKTILASNQKTSGIAEIALGRNIDVEDSWWPALQIPQSGEEKRRGIFRRRKTKRSGGSSDNSEFRNQDWRILTYRKRVGRGKACYEKVRNAALDWEFQSTDGTTGMMQIPDSSSSDEKLQVDPTIISGGIKKSYSVEPIDDGNSSAPSNLYRSLGSRRLVSFASKSVTAFLPQSLRKRLYSINPVMVVYDVVDQRAPDGYSTFTSTAYSTLKGHFLRGEERVTVALRDGSQDVDVEILSVSRAGPGFLGKSLWPFIGKMQSNFFLEQLDHLSKSGQVDDVEDVVYTNNGSTTISDRRYAF